MSNKISADRARFEKWHNEFYGSGPYSGARSLDLYDEETGLGYVNPTVQAQFCAFQGAAPAVERLEPVALFESVIGKKPDAFLHEPVYQVTESEVREFARLIAEQPAPVSAVLPRKFLISYKTPSGSGRFFNVREDESLPTEADILLMEDKLEVQHGVRCTTLQISEVSIDKVKELNQ